MAVPSSLGCNRDNHLRTTRLSSSCDYSIVTKIGDDNNDDTFDVDYPPSYERVYNEQNSSFSSAIPPPISGCLSGSSSSHFNKQPEFDVTAQLPVDEPPVRKSKDRRRRKPQQPGLTAKVRRTFQQDGSVCRSHFAVASSHIFSFFFPTCRTKNVTLYNTTIMIMLWMRRRWTLRMTLIIIVAVEEFR
jgi:hypothetical protein